MKKQSEQFFRMESDAVLLKKESINQKRKLKISQSLYVHGDIIVGQRHKQANDD